jgi:glutaredoxin 3
MLDLYIDPTGITIFSKTTCPYCVKAKQLLNGCPITIQTYELDTIPDGQFLAFMLKKQTRRTTIPNIFIYGKNIGGYDELKRMVDNGELSSIITNKKAPVIHDYFSNGFSEWGAPL